MLRAWAVLVVLMCCSPIATHAAINATLTERVTATKPGGGITLSASGNAVFMDVVFPDTALAESWLAEHTLQQEIHFTINGQDRYGNSQITSDIEEKMLQAGVAITYASEDKTPNSWRAAEATARTAKRGVWSDASFVLTPENAAQHSGEFHVVEGAITRTYEAKVATYINFGQDWHSDFSITIPNKIRRSMKDVLLQVKPGSIIGVRGYITQENGPMVKLLKPDNLELR